MGRKPKAAKMAQKTQLSNPSAGEVELESERNCQSVKRASLQGENINPSLGVVGSQHKRQAYSSNLFSKRKAKMKDHVIAVRHSKHLQNVVVSAHEQDIKRVIDEVTLSESDEPSHQEGGLPMGTLEEKIDYLLLKMKENKEVIEELKFKVNQDSVFLESPSSADIRYKKLYIDSQKKVESLKNENNQLALKLEVALAKLQVVESLKDENHNLTLKLETTLAKLEAHEKDAISVSAVLEKAKDLLVISHLTSATENAVNVSKSNSQVMEKVKDMMKRAAKTAINVSNQAMQDAAITPPSTSVQTKKKKLEERKKK